MTNFFHFFSRTKPNFKGNDKFKFMPLGRAKSPLSSRSATDRETDI